MSNQNQLGKYRLVAEIARGGMGIVFLASSEGVGGFQRVVVVKELKPELSSDPTFLAMFLDEAKLAARLHHPNIVQTNEVGSDGNRYFIAMEYLEGRTLQSVVRRGQELGDPSFTRAMYMRVICEILAGLMYAHTLADYSGTPLNIVHRDVNPQNVFLTYDGQIKLVDFGIAKTADQSQETKAGVLKGKISYMAPEQPTGQPADCRADLYSVGVMLAEAAMGQRLWGKSGEIEILTRLVRGDIPDPGAIRPDIPAELLRIIKRAMSFARQERYASAAELLVDLEAYMSASGETASPRDIGPLVSDRFAVERGRMKTLVEEHMTAAKDSLRVVPAIEAQLSGSAIAGLSDSSSLRSSSLNGGPSSSSLSHGVTPMLGMSATTHPSESTATKSTRSPMLLVGGGVLAGGVIAALVALSMRGGGTPAPSTAASATDADATGANIGNVVAPSTVSMPAASSAANMASAMANVRVSVSPANAQLSIDGKTVPGNPFVGTFSRGSGVHELRAVAPGYLPKSETRTFDATDMDIDMSLEHEPQVVWRRQPGSASNPQPPSPAAPVTNNASNSGSSGTNSAPTGATPASTSDINPNGGKAPRRGIDPSNPYATP